MDENPPQSTYERLKARYEEGNVPWDDELPPPEVIAFLADHPAGRALDLGCGYGRASIYMAKLGWEVDAIDFIVQAIAVAAGRSETAGVSVRFHLNSVIDLDYLAGPYDFALDVGCGHSFSSDELARYCRQLGRLLRPGGTFLFYGRLREENCEFGEQNGPRGIEESVLLETFSSRFDLIWSERGETKVPDQPIWPSAWFQFQRR